ncbi:TPA: hypothetical protein ACH9IQ_004939, partial [Escherichia coli]
NSAPIILITMSIDESHIYAVIRFIAIVIYCLSLVRKSRSLKLGETLNAIISSTEGDMCRQQKESFAALTQHKACIDAFLCGCTVICARTKTSLPILQQ